MRHLADAVGGLLLGSAKFVGRMRRHLADPPRPRPRGLRVEFRLTEIFSFFWWGEIRRISPQRGSASGLVTWGSGVAVRRNGLNFASGG